MLRLLFILTLTTLIWGCSNKLYLDYDGDSSVVDTDYLNSLSTDSSVNHSTDSFTDTLDTENKTFKPGTDSDTDTTVLDNSWTLMFYMNADNNLEPYMVSDLIEISNFTPPPWLEIVILFDRYPLGDVTMGNWTGTRLFNVEHDGSGLKRLKDSYFLNLSDFGDADELNLGDVKTLSNFISFSKNRFPANHYGLILSGHGEGWEKKGADEGTTIDPKYISLDETDGSSKIEIQSQLKYALQNKNIEVLGFDACLMGMIEVAWVFKDSVKYIIASQANEPAYGWDFQSWLSLWIDNIDDAEQSAKLLCTSQVESYKKYHDLLGYSPWPVTMAAYDLSKTEELGTAISNFAKRDFPGDYIGDAIMFEPEYPAYDLKNIATAAGDTDLTEAIDNFVISTFDTYETVKPGGISIYYTDPFNQPYTETDFCKQTDWCVNQ
ncbi:MAG: hypothetical protein JXR91_05795 [Deltaproteobacteria bacterium]|nr:hypothetical protein [Deltaproteobacteria bacterium]